jgi:hypothetical protein
MKHQLLSIVIVMLAVLISACGAQCPEGTIEYYPDLSTLPSAPDTLTDGGLSTMDIRTLLGRKTIRVDEIVRGSICNDHWSGTVYVTCDLKLPAWDENPFFLEECPVSIEPGSTVYVEAHRDKAYYEGCSCHE